MIGFFQDVLVRGLARNPITRAARFHLRGGPRAWFETNVLLATRAFGLASGFSVLTILVLELVARASFRIREPGLIALAVVGGLVVAGACAICVAFAAGWVGSHAFSRVHSLASLGAATLAAGLLFFWPLQSAVIPYWAALSSLGPIGLKLLIAAIAVAVVDGVVLIALRTHRWLRARSDLLTVASLTCALGVLLASASTLGRDQTVLSTILLRSAAARHLIAPLQHLVDRDGDGFGAWFGGGDCDDRDRRRHPNATDVPGNGIDENCSSDDAVSLSGSKSPTPSPAPRGARLASVLFVSVDAMRLDHMSVYGYGRPTTPNLSRFAERAVRFREAYTTSPQSVRSIASVMTGRHAASLVWRRDPRFPQLDASNTTLAEELRAHGHATAAFLNTSYFSLTAGFFQGFELVQEGTLFKDDEQVAVSRAVAWLDERRRNDEAFFSWVHIINPHAPYRDRTTPEDFGHEDVDRYDEELASTDAALEPILEALERLERDGHPVLTIIFSDHGEAFGEHGHVNHADCLHDEVLRIPVLVRAPGAPSADVRTLTSLVDLYATAMSFVGLAAQTGSSRSLMGVVQSPEACRNRPFCVRENARAEVAPTYGSTAMIRALVAPPWKLIQDVEHGAWELYDRRADPLERNNLYDTSPEHAAGLRGRLLDSGD
jgi:arylsulfatase A-like enzyme